MAYCQGMIQIRSSFRTPVASTLRDAKYFLADLVSRLSGRADPLTPPARLIARAGGCDFRWVGRDLVRVLADRGGLQPTARVVDIGCGAGRVALPLTEFLTPPGSYEGLDVDHEAIEWCSKNISARYAAFHFTFADVRNEEYNPDGPVDAASFRFPYPDSAFDFAVATSLFTHLLPTDLENYFGEISRVLVPRGTLVATFFLLNEESFALQASGASRLVFAHQAEHCRVLKREAPAAAVAYEEPFVELLLRRCGLEPKGLPSYGAWCGRRQFDSFQDVVVATRVA
jgi:SAM-dependent methyltransferase